MITLHTPAWPLAAAGILSISMFASQAVADGTETLGPPSIDAKRLRAHGARWERFAAVTSNVPFVAIFEGRNRLAIREIGAWRIALGFGLYVVLLTGHAWLFGASPMP